MYNDELKQRYIQDKTQRTTVDEYYYPSLFKKTSVFEEQLQKDLCNFTVSEIEDMMKMWGFTSYNNIATFLSSCSIYVNWCMNQGMVLDSQNHFAEIKPERYSSFVDKTIYEMRIASREQIMEWVMELQNPSDQFVFLGVFEGLKGKGYCEYVDLLESDIDIKSSTINLRNTRGKVKFSKELCNFGLQSAETLVYTPSTGKMSKETKLIESGKVIKDPVNMRSNRTMESAGRRTYFKLLRAFNYLGIDSYFDPNSLQNSGMIDMINRRSAELQISKTDYVNNYISEINFQYGKNYKAYGLIRKLGDICLT